MHFEQPRASSFSLRRAMLFQKERRKNIHMHTCGTRNIDEIMETYFLTREAPFGRYLPPDYFTINQNLSIAFASCKLIAFA